MLPQVLPFSSLSRRDVIASFSGGHISDVAGLTIMREVDRKLDLSKRLTACFTDKRQTCKVLHSVPSMIR